MTPDFSWEIWYHVFRGWTLKLQCSQTPPVLMIAVIYTYQQPMQALFSAEPSRWRRQCPEGCTSWGMTGRRSPCWASAVYLPGIHDGRPVPEGTTHELNGGQQVTIIKTLHVYENIFFKHKWWSAQSDGRLLRLHYMTFFHWSKAETDCTAIQIWFNF